MQDAMHIPCIQALFPGMPATTLQIQSTRESMRDFFPVLTPIFPAMTPERRGADEFPNRQFPFSLEMDPVEARRGHSITTTGCFPPPRPAPTPKKTTLVSALLFNTNNVPRPAIRTPVTVPTGREDLRPSKPRINAEQLQAIQEYLSKEIKENVAQELKEPLKEVKEQVNQEVKEQVSKEFKDRKASCRERVSSPV